MSVAFCCQVPAIFKWMGKFRQTFEPAFAGDVELLLEQEDWSTLTVWSLRHHSTCISTISWWGSQVEDHIGWSVKTGWKQKGKATRYAFSSSAASIIQASMSTDWYHVITHTHTRVQPVWCTSLSIHHAGLALKWFVVSSARVTWEMGHGGRLPYLQPPRDQAIGAAKWSLSSAQKRSGNEMGGGWDGPGWAVFFFFFVLQFRENWFPGFAECPVAHKPFALSFGQWLKVIPECFAIPVCSDDFYVACDWIENAGVA